MSWPNWPPIVALYAIRPLISKISLIAFGSPLLTKLEPHASRGVSVQKREQPNIALRLHVSIRRQLKDGATDPLFIASEALSDLQATETKS